jgi:hypothetical protein
MKLILTKSYLRQLIYAADGTTLIAEKFDPTTNIKNLDAYYKGDPYILLDVEDYSDKDFKRRINYNEITDYSTDGTTWLVRPTFAALVAAIEANIALEAESPI